MKIQLNFVLLTLIFSMIFAVSAVYSQEKVEGDIANGYDLFQANCTACHQVDGDFIGPPIRGVIERVSNEGGVGVEWLHAWIKDNKALRESGDTYANQVYEQYNRQEMLPFPNLTTEDINDILAYSQNPEAGEAAFKEAKRAEEEQLMAEKLQKQSSKGAYAGIIIAGFLIWVTLLIWVFVRLGELTRVTKSNKLT